MSNTRVKITFFLLHAVLAIIGASLFVMFATSTRGHPPGIVFAPLVFLCWVVGHVLLTLSHKLAKRGGASSKLTGDAGGQWPLEIVLISFVFGGILLFGIFALMFKLLFEDVGQRDLSVLLILWLPPSICFVGILLRQGWSRFLTSAVFIGAALFYGYRLVSRLGHSHQLSPLVWMIAVTLIVVLIFFGQHLLRSPRVKAYFSQ